MTHPNVIGPHQRWGRSAALAGLLLSCLLGGWSGCTAEKRYQVLSFFFDGVPQPGAATRPAGDEDEATRSGNANRNTRRILVTHKPFAQNQCEACHGASVQPEELARFSSATCAKCHEQVPRQYPVMHGPVAAGECTWCHQPHESEHKHLLRAAPPAVCVQCHTPDLLSPKVPEHLPAKRSCLDCHVAHGGPAHNLLRPVAANSLSLEGEGRGEGDKPSGNGRPPLPSAGSPSPAPTTAPAPPNPDQKDLP